MIVPTAPTLEGSRIVVHAGLVPGEAAMGAGGRPRRGDRRDDERGGERGANAAVGVDPDCEVQGDRGSMPAVSADGTAVAVE